MSRGNGFKGPIISAALGAAFFAVPYLALEVALLPALGIGAVAFGAGSLLFSGSTEENTDSTIKPFAVIISGAKKENAQIYAIISKVEDKKLQENIKELHSYAKKIIDTVEKSPKKMNQAQTFFNYYLPVALKILRKYDLIENQGLEYDVEIEKFRAATAKMLEKIQEEFTVQVSTLYQADMIDTDAEMKVFDSMLKSEGFSDINNFNIK